MKKNLRNTAVALILALMLCLSGLAGCAKRTEPATVLAAGGVLRLKVNPDLAIHYDAKGLVTSVTGRNDDGEKILADYSDFTGKECREVVRDLVAAIEKAGYFVEEVEGENRQIIIEIESGSRLPSKTFLDEVVGDVKNYVSRMSLQTPIIVDGESAYGITDYDDTDYGPGNDGVTDYDDTDYGPGNDGVTDYDDTDYGPGSDGVTDYDDTDYGPNNDGVTDYDDTDYGPGSDGVTDYDDTNYGASDYDDGKTDYDDGKSDYDDGKSDYDDGKSDYDDGKSDYDDGKSDYDDGKSDYDDGSDYGDSDYDD